MADKRRERAPDGIDVTVPSVARIYDFFLDGKDNFAADRELAAQIIRQVPQAANGALVNRRFLGRAVEFLANEGIRQFLDLGTGLPSQDNVHEVAQRACPDARVVYVDNDPVVSLHAQALLHGGGSTVVVQEDIRNPERILGHPDVRGMLDFSEPIAILFIAVLHFIPDIEDPWGIVSAMTEPLVPGSYLAVSHGTLDAHPPEVAAEIQKKYANTSAPAVSRGREAIGRFFDGFEMVEPGLVMPTEWRSNDLERRRPGGEWLMAGVGRKP
jgi:S-adenosyl methyltransferase